MSRTIIDVHQHVPDEGGLDARGEACARVAIVKMVNDYTKLMDALNLSPENREAIWHGTAERVLGL